MGNRFINKESKEKTKKTVAEDAAQDLNVLRNDVSTLNDTLDTATTQRADIEEVAQTERVEVSKAPAEKGRALDKSVDGDEARATVEKLGMNGATRDWLDRNINLAAATSHIPLESLQLT